MIALAAAAGATIALSLALVRLFAGPTLYDRALAANIIVVNAALICTSAAVAARRSEGVDVALALLLGALVVNIAVLKVFRARTFQAPLAQAWEGL